MKKIISILSSSLFILAAVMVVTANAGIYTFQPIPSDLEDLPHEYYYRWGINWNKPNDEDITAAKIEYSNIYNWETEWWDRLYTNLLDSVSDSNGSTPPNWVSQGWYETITRRGTDNHNNANAFSGLGVYNLGNWTDPDDDLTSINLSYSIPSDYFSWLADGNFGFGIDPDCHYYNSGIKFTIETRGTEVPEPSTILLLGSGLIGLGGYAKRKFRK